MDVRSVFDYFFFYFFFQAEDGIRDRDVTGVQTCALPISIAGKVLYAGISDTPAWQVARMQAIADVRGWTPFIALQIPYNLVERTVERDLIPMAKEMGLGVVPWSPLASGVLAGKYTKADLAIGG